MNKNKKNITILGLGKSGRAAVKLALSSGYSVCAVDSNDSDSLREFQRQFADNEKIQFIFGQDNITFPDSEQIVISPGIRPDSTLGLAAASSSVPTISELEFGLSFFNKPYLAVTGTNGKTTVTEMTTKILQHCGLNAVSVGNIGIPASEIALSNSNYDIAVVEASSFQLENTVNFSPRGAALLNIHSDHIDWHKSFDNYSNAKLKIFKNLINSNSSVINYNLLSLFKSAVGSNFKPFTFSYSSPNADIYYNSEENKIYSHILHLPISTETLKQFSKYNIENILAALSLSSIAIDDKKKLHQATVKLIDCFIPPLHRQELIAIQNGVKYINDSKSTNPLALIAALDASSQKDNSICLIAGGLDKQMDFSDVLKYKNKIKVVFLIGDSKKSLVSLWNYDIHCILCNSLKEAVYAAADFADSGDVVLLSPGCASMDMFENYQERGNVFRNLVLNDIIENKQMQMCSE